jgi:hypothetical protein
MEGAWYYGSQERSNSSPWAPPNWRRTLHLAKIQGVITGGRGQPTEWGFGERGGGLHSRLHSASPSTWVLIPNSCPLEWGVGVKWRM